MVMHVSMGAGFRRGRTGSIGGDTGLYFSPDSYGYADGPMDELVPTDVSEQRKERKRAIEKLRYEKVKEENTAKGLTQKGTVRKK